MTKEELIAKIQNTTLGKFIFVGPNGSGKSYLLSQIFNKVKNCIFIDEEGFTKATDKRQGYVNDDTFVYENKYNRGLSGYQQETEKLNIDSLNIVKTLNKLKNSLPTKNKSAGIKKIENIINNILSRNINGIKYFLFDEPDNYLDDKHIKFTKNILEILMNNSKVVCIVSHNPRLLEILNTDIDDIYIFNNWLKNDVVNVTSEQLKQVYLDCCDSVSEIRLFENCTPKEKFFYSKKDNLVDINLYNIIHSYDFYRTLFYDKVVLAEGLTEKLVFNEIDKFQIYVNNFYFCKGKSRYPLLIRIFEQLKKEIVLIFDEDGDNKDKFTFTINSMFDNYKKIVFTPNLEDELIIIEDIIKIILGDDSASNSKIDDLMKTYKAEILPFALRKDENLLKQLENKVAQIIDDKYETFN